MTGTMFFLTVFGCMFVGAILAVVVVMVVVDRFLI